MKQARFAMPTVGLVLAGCARIRVQPVPDGLAQFELKKFLAGNRRKASKTNC